MKTMNELSNRERQILEKAREAGVMVTRQGHGWRLTGEDVDILTARLTSIWPDELKPAGSTAYFRMKGGDQWI